MDQIEAYGRGLAMAEGSVEGSAVRIEMTVPALSVLKVLADRYSVNGIRIREPHGFGIQKTARIRLRHCASWKTDTSAVELNAHAVRGYLEGDGYFWTRKQVTKGKVYRYLSAAFLFHPAQLYIRDWVRRYLISQDLRFTERICHRIGTVDLHEILLQRHLEAERLKELLYKDSIIHFKY